MNASDLFENVTAELVAAIEAGARGFRMPWHRLAAGGLPRSVDGRPYRGWNALVLGLTAADRDWSSSTWATYSGWQRHDAQVRRGERGTRVVLWKPSERAATPDDGEESGSGRSLFARTFTVFAAEQVDGAELYRGAKPERPECERIAEADAYFAAAGAHVVHGGNVACYVPSTDTIHLPSLTQFDQPGDYYSTAAHEHVHRTGHESRIGRDLSGRFGDHAYGAEELIAELGAAFWCAQFGLVQATRDDHAKYLGDWLALLSPDSRALVAACGHAQRAVDWLNAAAGVTPAAEIDGAESMVELAS